MSSFDPDPGLAPAPKSDRRGMIVVIDDRVPDSEFLLAALMEPADAIRIGPMEDGLERVLKTAQKIRGHRLVIICHGAPGALMLGDRTLNREVLLTRRDTLNRIGRALGGGPIALYACSVAEGRNGQAFLAALASGTGCPVSASSLMVGDTAKGGSWSLDTMVSTDRDAMPEHAGLPETGPFDQDKLPAYRHLLACTAVAKPAGPCPLFS